MIDLEQDRREDDWRAWNRSRRAAAQEHAGFAFPFYVSHAEALQHQGDWIGAWRVWCLAMTVGQVKPAVLGRAQFEAACQWNTLFRVGTAVVHRANGQETTTTTTGLAVVQCRSIYLHVAELGKVWLQDVYPHEAVRA